MELRLKTALTTRDIDLAVKQPPMPAADWDTNAANILDSLRGAGKLDLLDFSPLCLAMRYKTWMLLTCRSPSAKLFNDGRRMKFRPTSLHRQPRDPGYSRRWRRNAVWMLTFKNNSWRWKNSTKRRICKAAKTKLGGDGKQAMLMPQNLADVQTKDALRFSVNTPQSVTFPGHFYIAASIRQASTRRLNSFGTL